MWLSVALTITIPWGASAQPTALVATSWERSVVMASSEALTGRGGSISDAAWSMVNRDVPIVEVQVGVTRDAVPVVAHDVGLSSSGSEALLLSEAVTQGWVPLAEMLDEMRVPLSLVIRISQEL